MAATVTTDYSSLGGIIVEDTAVSNTAIGNPTGMSSGGFIYYIEVDNTMNSAVTYFKIFDHASPTIGTTEPEVVLKIAASQRQYMVVPNAYPLNTAASYAAFATSDNSAASPAGPGNAVTIRLVITNS
jgi:hypothetical protein